MQPSFFRIEGKTRYDRRRSGRVTGALPTWRIPCWFRRPSALAASGTRSPITWDRPLRVDLVLDPATGAILKRTDFSSKPWLDRAIGTGIAAHEGALFGVANQMVSLFTTLGLVTLSLSGLAMWWRGRPESTLGAPGPLRRVRWSAGLIGLLIAFGVYFPFLGGSMIVVLLVERFVLRRMEPVRVWLGLLPERKAAAAL